MNVMAKRGRLEYKALIILIISAVVFIFFLYIGQSYANSDVYKKGIASREIALIIDSMYAYPYDSTIYYERDLAGFTLEIADGKVIVYNKGFNKKNDPTLAEYAFFVTGVNNANIKLEDSKKIKIQKNMNNLIIEKLE